jgi:hypothetical protein
MTLAANRTGRRSFLRRVGGLLVAGAGGLRPGGSRADAMPAIEDRAAAFVRAYDAEGVHRTAQVGDEENADFLAGEAKALGAEVSFDEFAIERVEPVVCYVELKEARIPAFPMFDGAFTGPQGLDGKLGALGQAAPIALAEEGPLAVYRQDYSSMREGLGHQGIVIVTKGERPGLALLNAESFLSPYGVPCVQVASEAREALLQAVALNEEVRLVADCRRVPSRVRSVVASLKGTTGAGASLVVMTPRSGWWHCASERGGGLFCWLEVLRALHETPPERDVILVASRGHELGHIGLDNFIKRQPRLMTEATWLHFGANIGAAGGMLTLQSPQDDLRDLVREEMARAAQPIAGFSPKTQVPFGESRAIHRAGGRYLTLIGSNPLFHLPQDRWPAAVDVGSLAKIAAACASLAVALSRQAKDR